MDKHFQCTINTAKQRRFANPQSIILRFGSRIKRQWYYILLVLVVSMACAAPLKQFYPDTFYPEDHVYENKPLRFVLKFDMNWELITDPNELSRSAKTTVVNWARAGIELLFIGSTVEGLHTTRGMVEHLNMSPREFAGSVRKNSRNSVTNDQGLADMVMGKNSMVKWIYDKDGFRYAEFFFTIDTYDIRIAFCSRPVDFARFLPVYESIMSTLQVTGGL